MAAPAPDLSGFLDLWGLELVGRPTGGRERYPGTGDVAFVRRGGAELVLKTIPAGTDEARSAEVLAHWGDRRAVRVIEHADGAVLIERARPGEDLTGLVHAGDDDAATDILADVMAELHARPVPPGASFRTVEDWGGGFGRNREAAIDAGIVAGLIDRAARMFEQLCATQGPRVVLHGDLQHYNVVRDDARGWLAIDPKGVLGEAAYETGAMLRNPDAPDLLADRAILDRRVGRLSERLGHDRERLLGWAFSQWMLAIMWAIEDHFPYSPDWLKGPLAAESLLR
jgi:streptomycin 6-kinase